MQNIYKIPKTQYSLWYRFNERYFGLHLLNQKNMNLHKYPQSSYKRRAVLYCMFLQRGHNAQKLTMNFTKNEYTFTVYSISDLLKYKKKNIILIQKIINPLSEPRKRTESYYFLSVINYDDLNGFPKSIAIFMIQ